MFGIDALTSNRFLIFVTIVAMTFVVAWITLRILDIYVRRLTENSRNKLDDVLLKALKTPLTIFIAIVGSWLAFEQSGFLGATTSPLLNTIFFVAYLALGYIVMIRLVVGLLTWYDEEIAVHTNTEIDEQILPLVRRVVVIIFSLITFIALLDHFAVDVRALVATLGVTSLAIALAAQAVLEDMISGFILNVDRPFRIGDRIELQELDTWGDVQDIGLRSTRILTRDHRLVSIPNSIIARNSIVNHSIPSTQFRVETHVEVAYGCDIDYVRKVLVDAVKAEGWIMHNKPVEALFLNFNDSGLQFRVRCWIEHYVETRRIIDKLNTAIYKALNSAEVEIPFPQRVVHLQTVGQIEQNPS